MEILEGKQDVYNNWLSLLNIIFENIPVIGSKSDTGYSVTFIENIYSFQ